ncbi:UDP-glucose 4-epimerase GalE [Desulfotomaculum nigrificans]|uniref:UDP-glucose 4-epimerase GalE n=1 Tax=Desulfotomaculum nigrificans TaxID=1565 RepID=UPI0001FAEAE4|nr:UDP-glucose 4-epimerase GalE [Desulfotomaculum nigrificans]
MQILVCGGAGYIGSHAVRELYRAGYEVLVLDNLVKGHREAIGDIPLVEVDINDKPSLEQVFQKQKIDAVMHFAAYSLVGESVVEPAKYYHNNVLGTLNLMEVMLSYGVKRIIFSSTAAVYGEPVELPITEEHPTRPTNPYGATKLAVEGMLHWFGQAYGLNYVSLRYFNAAGADVAGDIGEDHQPETHLIPLVLQTALGVRPEIKIFGTDYPTPDGTCIRDYIHVTDLANAHLLALEKIINEGGSAIYNLGNGSGFSVREVIQVAQEVTGKLIKVMEAERRPGDPAVLVASSEKIKKELGWQPRYADLKTVISTAWHWHSKHPDGYISK